MSPYVWPNGASVNEYLCKDALVQIYIIARPDISMPFYLFFSFFFSHECVSVCVEVAHIWSESVRVSGRWLGREVAGAIENLRCFHRDDGNLRDFP